MNLLDWHDALFDGDGPCEMDNLGTSGLLLPPSISGKAPGYAFAVMIFLSISIFPEAVLHFYSLSIGF